MIGLGIGLKQRAFSLIEMVVSLSIICVVMILAIGLIPSSVKGFEKSLYYQFASSEALLILNSAIESELPQELKTSHKYPLYNSIKDLSLHSLKPYPLPFCIFGEKLYNPGIVSYKNDKKNINFIYLITYGKIDEISDSMLVDISVDIWWSEKNRNMTLETMDKNINYLSHICYIQRIYKRGTPNDKN